MPRTKASARKCVGPSSSLVQAMKRARQEVKYTWVFYMVRLIDVEDKLDVDGAVTADKIMDIFDEMEGAIYTLFGLEQEQDHEPYIAVGKERRTMRQDRVDVYILVGLKVREGTDVDLFYDISETWCDWFCRAGESIELDEDNTYVVQDDVSQVEWLERIVADMEDTSFKNDIHDVITKD